MGYHLEKLALRRQALLLKTQAQRQVIALHYDEFKQSLELANLALNACKIAGNAVRQRPAIGMVIAAAILILKPRRALSLAKTALVSWQTWKNLSPLLQRYRSNKKTQNPVQ